MFTGADPLNDVGDLAEGDVRVGDLSEPPVAVLAVVVDCRAPQVPGGRSLGGLVLAALSGDLDDQRGRAPGGVDPDEEVRLVAVLLPLVRVRDREAEAVVLAVADHAR